MSKSSGWPIIAHGASHIPVGKQILYPKSAVQAWLDRLLEIRPSWKRKTVSQVPADRKEAAASFVYYSSDSFRFPINAEMHNTPKLDPIGIGFVREIKTKAGARYVARWNAYTLNDAGERTRITCGPHELGPKVSRGPGVKSLSDVCKAWDNIYWSVFTRHHPAATLKPSKANRTVSATTLVKDFITSEFEARRKDGWEENSKINWEYYRDSLLLPFFGELTITDERRSADPAFHEGDC
jgi:hypothetical protein